MVSRKTMLLCLSTWMVVNKLSLYSHIYTVMVSQVHTYVKTYQILHFKYVQLLTYKLHLKKAFKNDSRFKKSVRRSLFGNPVSTLPSAQIPCQELLEESAPRAAHAPVLERLVNTRFPIILPSLKNSFQLPLVGNSLSPIVAALTA